MKRFVQLHAHVVTLLWAAGWTQFCIWETHRWGTVASQLWIPFGLLFLALAGVAWRWELLGGTLLVICGLGLLLAYDIWPPRQLKPGLQVIILLLLAVPPLLAGFLMIGHHTKFSDLTHE